MNEKVTWKKIAFENCKKSQQYEDIYCAIFYDTLSCDFILQDLAGSFALLKRDKS